MNALIGVRLTNLRKKRNLNQKKVAQGIISKSYLSNIERGNKYPGEDTLCFLCERLEVSPDELSTSKLPNEVILEQLEEIFQSLILGDFQKAEKLLTEIDAQQELHNEAAFIEIAYYMLLAAFYYKNWSYERAADIEKKYLSSVHKVVPQKVTNPEFLRYYFYYQVQKKVNQCDYEQSLAAVTAFVEVAHPASVEKVMMWSNMMVLQGYLAQYESALIVADKVLEEMTELPKEHQMYGVKIIYMQGFSYYAIKFYIQAQRSFEKTLSLLEEYPEMKPQYELLTLCKQSQTLQINGETAKAEGSFDKMFHIIKRKNDMQLTFTPNEILSIANLLVHYAENNKQSRVAYLLTLTESVENFFEELTYFIDFSRALHALNQGDEIQYEALISQLLKKIDQLNEQDLVDKIKKQASEYFSKKMMYKKSYSILK